MDTARPSLPCVASDFHSKPQEVLEVCAGEDATELFSGRKPAPLPHNTSDDEVGGRGQLVHTGLDRADVFPSMLQLDVPDHQIPS